MTQEEFELLKRSEIIQFLEKNINEPSAKIALSRKGNDRHPALVYSQLKFLQKSKKKLPSFYKKRCILPPRAYEQSSSERAARHKAFNGTLCLDLCCGLGVDTFLFSKAFKKVISLEADSLLAAVTAHNMNLLGSDNVKVIPSSAEAFLETYNGPPFDLIYADPDRRDVTGQRKVRLEDCQPDILAMLPLIRKHTQRLVLKVSPLFDTHEAVRIFSDNLASVSVVTIDNECKEVLIECDFSGFDQNQRKTTVICDRHGDVKKYHFSKNDELYSFAQPPDTPSTFLCEPDVGFFKANVVLGLFANYFPNLKGQLTHPQGIFLTNEPPEDFPGRVFQIKGHFPYKPKQLKKIFGKQRLNIVKRNFPFSVKEIRRQTGVQEGGDLFLYCTVVEKQKTVFLLALA